MEHPNQPTVAIKSEEPGNVVEPITEEPEETIDMSKIDQSHAADYIKAETEAIPEPEPDAAPKTQTNPSDLEALTAKNETAGKSDSKIVTQGSARRSLCSRLRPTVSWTGAAAVTGTIATVAVAAFGIYLGVKRRM